MKDQGRKSRKVLGERVFSGAHVESPIVPSPWHLEKRRVWTPEGSFVETRISATGKIVAWLITVFAVSLAVLALFLQYAEMTRAADTRATEMFHEGGSDGGENRRHSREDHDLGGR